ncbi:hypothetical protein B9G55_11915 [Saccharibacillus sp. O16]|nr:hypothetical protein B9G55_11915 [Saccharibacillus sp. O16]
MSDFFARSATYSYHLYLSADGGGKFWLSATDGEGPVLLRDALTPLPRYMLPEYRLNREETPVRASRLLVVRDTLLKAIERGDAPGLHLHMGDEVELAMLADPEGIGLTFFLDGERSSLIGRLPDQAAYLEPGWFGRFVDAGYELIDLPGFEEDDLDWIGRRIGTDEWEELLTTVIPAMRSRGLWVHSEVESSPEPAGRIEILDCDEDSVRVRISSGEAALLLEGLNGYVLQPVQPPADGSSPTPSANPAEPVQRVTALPEVTPLEAGGAAFLMRPSLDTAAAVRLLGSAAGGTASGDALAEFARRVEYEWGTLVTGEAAAKFRDLHRLYDAADWSWSLRGGPVLERGVGVVRAEPVLSAGGRRFTAAELTDAWTQGRRYLRLEDGWIDLEAPEFARSLREHGAGGGASGLISAGFSYRQRIGLPGELAAGELPLELEGPRPAEAGEAKPALAHLRYLAGWGMNGGLHGGVEPQLAELATWAAETLAASPDCRLMVVGRRELLTALAEASGLESTQELSGAAEDSTTGFTSGAYLPEAEKDDSAEPRAGSLIAEGSAHEAYSAVYQTQGGLILVPVSLLQRADDEGKLQADILLLLEPDVSVRSDETRLFSRLDGAEARVRIAVYSDEGQMNDARVRAVQIRLLKLYDSLTRSFLLLDPNRGSSTVGARPPLRDVPTSMKLPSWRKEGGMAELFVDEAIPQPQAPIRGGMAIPPRSVEPGSDSRFAGGQSASQSANQSERSRSWPAPDPRDVQVSKPTPEPRTESAFPVKRRTPTYGSEARPIRPVQQQSAEKEFVARARADAERSEPEVPFVPFSSYWPTYAAMKPEQERWYFYWRSQFRAGEKVETDLSYLFIYIYELINGVGWEHPGEGLAAMIAVWESYRARFRRLDSYMADWVREFALVHALDLPESSALEQTAGQLKGELLDLELSRRFGGQPAALTWELIARLSDYDLTTSRFYKDAGKKAMLRVLPLIVQAVDEHLAHTRGIRLLGLFREADTRITERYLFRSAVYDPEAYGRTFLVRAPKLGLHAPLRDFMTQLTRQTENELRARFKFGGRLRGIQLDAEIVEVIAAAVEREFVPPEQRVLPEPPKRPEVKLDLEELEKLRRDSEEVMRMLTGELMTSAGGAAPDSGNLPSASASAAEASGSENSSEQTPSENPSTGETSSEDRTPIERPGQKDSSEETEAYEPFGLQTMELPEDRTESWSDEPVPGALSFEPEQMAEGEKASATASAEESWANASLPAEQGQDTTSMAAEESESFPSQSGRLPEADQGIESQGGASRLDNREITGKHKGSEQSSLEASEFIQVESMSARSIHDEPVHDAATQPLHSTSETSASVHQDEWDTSELDEDWQELVSRLGTAERSMIRAVLLGLSDAERMNIAGAVGELQETMIDRINEAAMETIGDLLIDSGEVLEEYVPELERCIPTA